MTDAFDVALDNAAESAPETVIAAIGLLDERSVDMIVSKLMPRDLKQVIKIVGCCPRGYPPGRSMP